MNRMSYYLSRAFISIVLGGLIALTVTPWWISVFVGLVTFVLFLWAPRSGRYADSEGGVTPLERDERSRAIVGKASRNAFLVTLLLLAALTVYFGVINPGSVSVNLLSLVLFLGMLTYFVSDYWLRRH